MIIIDDDLPRKLQPLPHALLLGDAMSTELASFRRPSSSVNSDASSSTSRETPAPLPPSYEASIQVGQDRLNKRKRRRRRRIWIPAIIILNIVILLSILLPRKLRKKHPSLRHGPQWLPILNGFKLPPLPQHPFAHNHNNTDDAGNECKSWSNSQSADVDKTNSATFTIKPKKNIVFNPAYCKRSQSAGSLNVIFDDVIEETDFVLDVRAKFMRTKHPTSLEACVDWTADSLSFNHKVKGESSGYIPDVLLDLTLHLPISGDFRIQNFTSLLINFDHNFGNSVGGQVFDNLQIFSMASSVASKGVSAKSINISSGMKGIQGRFSAQELLHLKSDLAPINVNLDLESVNGNPVTFKVETINSPINATLTLSERTNSTYLNDTLIPRIVKFSGNVSNTSITRRDEPPAPSLSKFSGNITNANGPLYISIVLDDDLDYSAITLHAETSLKPAHIKLDHRFEGNFAVEAKSSSANVEDLSVNGLYTGGPARATAFDWRGNSSFVGWSGFPSKNGRGENISNIALSNELGSALVSFSPPAHF